MREPLWFTGESGIRTHGDISATFDFESSALDQLSHLSFPVVAAPQALRGGILHIQAADVKQFLLLFSIGDARSELISP